MSRLLFEGPTLRIWGGEPIQAEILTPHPRGGPSYAQWVPVTSPGQTQTSEILARALPDHFTVVPASSDPWRPLDEQVLRPSIYEISLGRWPNGVAHLLFVREPQRVPHSPLHLYGWQEGWYADVYDPLVGRCLTQHTPSAEDLSRLLLHIAQGGQPRHRTLEWVPLPDQE